MAAVIVDDGLVLACRRAPGTASSGLWELPGGKVESGETEPEALVREIAEELGVAITVGELLTRDVTRVGARHIQLSCWWATLQGERPSASTDHDLMEWVQPSRLDELAWATPDLPAVRLLVDGAAGA